MAQKTASISLMKRLVMKDAEGKIIYDSGLQPSHSFVKQFIESLVSLFTDDEAGLSVKTEGGLTVSFATQLYWDDATVPLDLSAAVNDDSHGILVGSASDIPEENDNYQLNTPIEHGTGAGQLQYGAQQWNSAVVVGDNVDWEIYRVFTNGSGGNVDVKEIGIYCHHQYNIYYFMIARDIIYPLTVPNGGSLTVYYTMRTTV